MTRTRRSLFYLVTYLSLTGVILMADPQAAFKLFLSMGHYDDIFPRLMGMFLIDLAIVVAQIIGVVSLGVLLTAICLWKDRHVAAT